jgi:hypothetical protein
MRTRFGAGLLAFVAFLCSIGSAARCDAQPYEPSAGSFQTFEGAGGGRIITGALGKALSLQTATEAVLRRIRSEFGRRPDVTQTAENPRGHSIALFFTESRDGKSYTGLSVIDAVPGAQASGAVLYDTTARFGSTIGGLLHRVPERELGPQFKTAAAILESVRINFGAAAAQSAAIRGMFKQRFDAMIADAQAGDRARQAQTDEALATDRAAQEGMHRQAVSMENFTLGRTAVVNATSGTHSTVGSNFADALVRGDSDYQKVPASELLRGVDY